MAMNVYASHEYCLGISFWVVNGDVSWADFTPYSLVEFHMANGHNCGCNFPNLCIDPKHFILGRFSSYVYAWFSSVKGESVLKSVVLGCWVG